MTDDLDQPEAENWAIAVPFVVCESQGGPYDDDAFAAGFDAGRISQALKSARAAGATALRYTVRTALVTQLDLIAMDAGFTLSTAEVEETEDHPAMPEWMFATFEATAA
jgi:Arc/MetJ family transcription regulator